MREKLICAYLIGVAPGRVANPEDLLASFRTQVESNFRYIREFQWARLAESQSRFFEQTGRVSVILRGVWVTVAPEIKTSIAWDKRNVKRRKQALLNVEKITVKPVSNITQSDFDNSGYSREELKDKLNNPQLGKFNPFSPVTIIELARLDI